jgi:hypothetical protein
MRPDVSQEEQIHRDFHAARLFPTHCRSAISASEQEELAGFHSQWIAP